MLDRMRDLYVKFKLTEAYSIATDCQKRFFDAYFRGENICLTGPAGTGKSFALNSLSNFLEKQGIAIGMTAMTGVAAFNIKGQTIHSWAGIGLGDDSAMELYSKVKGNKIIIDKIMETHTLVIDEVSMLKADLMEKLNNFFKIIRMNTHEAFGGIQMIFCGDFLQLPPVWVGDEEKDFAFNSSAWKEANVITVDLKQIVRQHNDPAFAKLLNELRFGDTSGLDLLRTRIDYKFPEDGIEPVYLFCKNYDVEKLNKEMLHEVSGDIKTFKSKDSGSPYHISFFDKHCPAIANLELKIGAQVMLLNNLDTKRGLVNGSIGKVKGWSSGGIIVTFQTGDEIISEFKWELKELKKVGSTMQRIVVASRTQYPLKIAYALTVHKSQGSTLDRAVIDISEAFAEGQVYVALSRVRDLKSLSVSHFSHSRVKVNSECVNFYKNIKS